MKVKKVSVGMRRREGCWIIIFREDLVAPTVVHSASSSGGMKTKRQTTGAASGLLELLDEKALKSLGESS